MELKYAPALQEFAPIVFNYEELKEELEASLQKYQSLTYSDSTIKEAKADRANLNKLKDAFDTERKKVKKICLAPFEDFEFKVKNLITLIDEPISAIDSQVKAYEHKKEMEKLKEITAFYLENIGSLQDLVPLEKILNPKWKNATVSLKNVQEELLEKIEKINFEIETIKKTYPEEAYSVIQVYLKDFDLSRSMAAHSEYLKQKEILQKREEERRLAEEAKKVKLPSFVAPKVETVQETSPVAVLEESESSQRMDIQAVRKRIIQLHKEKGTRAGVVAEMMALEKEYNLEPVRQIDFRVWIPETKIEGLKQYLIDNGIEYGSCK